MLTNRFAEMAAAHGGMAARRGEMYMHMHRHMMRAHHAGLKGFILGLIVASVAGFLCMKFMKKRHHQHQPGHGQNELMKVDE